MVAFSALVEKLGLVLPSRNGPHSGCPYAPQPSGLRARLKMSEYPSGVFGYPSASAIGFGIAMTSGVSWSGVPAGAIAFLPASARRLFTTRPHAPEAGDHAAGRGPLAFGFGQSSASNDAASPDDFDTTCTLMHWPSRLARSESLKRLARSVSRSTFSGDTCMSTVMQSAARATPGVSACTVAATASTASAAPTVRLTSAP